MLTLNLSNIGHAADTKSEVLSVQGLGNRLGYGRLSCARRTVETQYLALGVTFQLTDSYKLLQKAYLVSLQNMPIKRINECTNTQMLDFITHSKKPADLSGTI